MSAQPRPLGAFRIVEVNAPDAPVMTRLATAMAGKIAADLGATVIKIEPAGGDPIRFLPPFLAPLSAHDARGLSAHDARGERSALFQFLNTSKRSAATDSPALRARLVGAADAMITDDPSLIGVGTTPRVRVLISPMADRRFPHPPLEQIDILAMSGLMDIVGEPDGPPTKLGGHQCAYTAGLAAFTGLVAALANTGVAEIVDVSVLDVALWTNWKTFADRLYTGRAPTRPGAVGEFQVLACADGHAAFVYTEKDWPILVRLFADPALSGPQFATRAGRQAAAGAIHAIIAPWFAARSRAEIYAAAKAAGVPLSAVWRLSELERDPQYIAQKFLAEIADPVLGARHLPTLPLVWNGDRFAPIPAPALAEMHG